MNETEYTRKAKTALIAFLDAMRDWESKHYDAVLNLSADSKNSKLAEQVAMACDELKVIFDAHCVPEKTDTSRLTEPRVSSPPVYDRQHGTLYEGTSTKNGITFVYQQHDGIQAKLRFSMKKGKNEDNGNDEWRLLKVERFDDIADDWFPYPL